MFKIGCDPELFMQDAAGGFISAIGRIGGSKHAPIPLVDLGDGFAVQEDNVAVEFNIPAAESVEEFQLNVNKVIKFLSDGIMTQGLHFADVSAVSFPEEQLLDPRALEFGCDPDFCAWTGRKNPRPKTEDKNLRSCGGHVHVGYQFADKQQAMECIKAMDVFLGIPSVLMDEGELRKNLYGKWGAFRFKPYGVEYRTLSNFWVFDNKLIKWVWDGTARALDAVRNGMSFDNDKELIRHAINNNDKITAANLVGKYNLNVV